MEKPLFVVMAALAAVLVVSAPEATAQETSIPKTLEAVSIFASNCSTCHDWAGSYEAILASGSVVPGKSGDSPAWLAISRDIMPPTGALPEEDKALILAWIDAGAPKATDGLTGASAPLPSTKFLGFKSKESFHRFSGWASGGILLAAGVVGAAHAYDMWSTAHAYRDSFPEDSLNDGNSQICRDEIAKVWGSPTEQTLRWTHVGLLAAGESFYVANALTGAGFMGKLGPGWSKSKIHRYAFFVHAGLMAAEAVMGYFSSEALRQGDHETFSSLLVAHAGVGLAIPVIILGAGAVMDPRLRL